MLRTADTGEWGYFPCHLLCRIVQWARELIVCLGVLEYQPCLTWSIRDAPAYRGVKLCIVTHCYVLFTGDFSKVI